MSKDKKIAKLQAQVEARSAEEDTLTVKSEAITKESEGQSIAWFAIQQWTDLPKEAFIAKKL